MKRRPGRPLKMTPLRVSIIVDAMADGANISQACARAGVHPSTYALTLELLQETCQRCRYPYARLLDILHDYPQAWARMLIKRAYRHAGIPDAQVSEDQIEAAQG